MPLVNADVLVFYLLEQAAATKDIDSLDIYTRFMSHLMFCKTQCSAPVLMKIV